MADKKQETIADVMRKIRHEIAELRKVSPNVPSVAADWWEARADEIEAAHKREIEATAAKCCQLGRLAGYGASEIKHQQESVGDAAKLYEAVGYILEYADSAACRDHDEHTRHYIDQIRKWAQSALAEPPRNCDKYATADEALKAQEQMFNDSNFANGECKLGCPECDNPRVGCKIAWLFAPATEKEGGAK